MMQFSRLSSLALACAFIFFGARSLFGLEPWADPTLPVTNSLELWLNASRENAARAPTNRSPIPRLPNNGPVDTWHDGSGNGRHLRQFIPDARPRFMQSAQSATVRFDGKDDFLLATTGAERLTNFTIFVQGSPRSNKGGFRSFLACSELGKNDYNAGLNIDLGYMGTPKFNVLNVEGAGFTGARNLLRLESGFDQSCVLTIGAGGEPGRVKLWRNGALQGERDRGAADVGFAVLTVGARYYSNSGEPPFVQGFLDGDISQVLIYNRLLTDQERSSVERFLLTQTFSQATPGRKMVMLEPVTNAPPIQMFLPGFTVQQLALSLNNINCVKYRTDGKVVALGYDGTIWLLSDTDIDGVEDKAAPFWQQNTLRAPIGLALTPDNYGRGTGAFVAAKGKLSLIVDTNKDDVADQEIVVAQGWKELPHGVDALGVAVAADGSVYFGLGTANFTDAYLLDPATRSARYDLKNERGTILKVSADFSHREIVCTGIRFPVALAFNPAGDLFCTDQEGATWLPNGNPFDELLFIERARHYGFPPRHPKHLPQVIDEPSVFDYAPQHQSTCGLNFNEPVAGGRAFGPEEWRGDALVTGYSRGKLYRTKLTKTPSGYVAMNQVIGSVNGLPADACVTPRGALLVAVHSGTPDWGSGPTGPGKLYQIAYSKNPPVRPVAVWAASETETLVEFAGQLDPEHFKDWKNRIRVTEGRYVGAGDRYEMLRPGYQAVTDQLTDPRYELEVLSTALSSDGTTLAIRTSRRDAAVNYALSLPSTSLRGTGQNDATIELAHDLTGVEALWEPRAGSPQSIWLPHLSLEGSRQFSQASKLHASFWSALKQPGTLTLRGQLDLWQMLRAAVQPGAKLDFQYPSESVTVVLKSDCPLTVEAKGVAIDQVNEREKRFTVSKADVKWVPLEVKLSISGESPPALDVSWFTAEDARPRALPLRRILLPWAKPAQEEVVPQGDRTIPELVGANWLRGQNVFFGEKAACAKCHSVRGFGGRIGPDLSNLVQRDYASVLRDIVQPSAAINPDHVAYNIELTTAEEALSGIPLTGEDGSVLMADATGRLTPVQRSRIRSMKPSTVSLMPEGLLEGLPESARKDLLSFLLTPPPLEPAPLEIPGAPEERSYSQLQTLLGNSPKSQSPRRIQIVLCAGPKDHGPGEHDYPLWQKRWASLLKAADQVSVETAWEWPTSQQLQSADVVVFYSNNPGWSPARASELDSFLARGGGAAFIHYAVDGHNHCEELARRIGLAWRGGASLFRHGPLDLTFAQHPITEGFSTANFLDESYWNLVGSEQDIKVLATGIEGGKSRPLLWVREEGKGRVFVSIPGHYTWTFDDPLFRLLLLRGIAWTAGEPLDRFNALATLGARVATRP